MRRDVFQAIADPTRREIVEKVASGEYNLNELASQFAISRPAVSKHVKILQECGLIETEKKGREKFCKARLEKLGEVAIWVHQYRRFWNKSLDKLEALIEKDNSK